MNPKSTDDFSCGSFVQSAGRFLRYLQAKSGAWFTSLGGFSCDMGSSKDHGMSFENYKMLFAAGAGEFSRPANIPLNAIFDGYKLDNLLPKSAAFLCGGTDLQKLYGGDFETRAWMTKILERVRDERIDISTLHWRDLEGLVAALLEERGLKVTVTKRTRDGGRDIIAAGEIIPGDAGHHSPDLQGRPSCTDWSRRIRQLWSRPARNLTTRPHAHTDSDDGPRFSNRNRQPSSNNHGSCHGDRQGEEPSQAEIFPPHEWTWSQCHVGVAVQKSLKGDPPLQSG